MSEKRCKENEYPIRQSFRVCRYIVSIYRSASADAPLRWIHLEGKATRKDKDVPSADIYVLPGDEIHDPNYASWRGIRMWCTLVQYREFVDLLRHGTHALCFYVQEKEEDKPRAGLKEYVRISAESEEMPGEQRDPYVFPRPSVESQDLVTFE